MKHHECLRCPSEASTASTAVDRDSPCADAKCAGKEDEISSIFFSASSVTARLQERVQGLEQELKRNRVRCALLKTALHQKRQVLTLAMQHLEPDGSSAFRAKLARSDIGDHIVNFCRVYRCIIGYRSQKYTLTREPAGNFWCM